MLQSLSCTFAKQFLCILSQKLITFGPPYCTSTDSSPSWIWLGVVFHPHACLESFELHFLWRRSSEDEALKSWMKNMAVRQGFQNILSNDLDNGLQLLKSNFIWFQDDEAYSAYDAMTARELFRRAGVSAKLYQEFLEPILLVTLFAPGEQLSGTPFCKSAVWMAFCQA